MSHLKLIQDNMNPDYLKALEVCGSAEHIADVYRKMYGHKSDDQELEAYRNRNVYVAIRIMELGKSANIQKRTSKKEKT